MIKVFVFVSFFVLFLCKYLAKYLYFRHKLYCKLGPMCHAGSQGSLLLVRRKSESASLYALEL